MLLLTIPETTQREQQRELLRQHQDYLDKMQRELNKHPFKPFW